MADAVAEAKRAAAIDGQNLLYLAAVGHAYARAGRQREARTTLARLSEAAKTRYVSAYDVALIHFALGNREQGFSALERAYAEQSVMIGYLRVDPRPDVVRDDARFKRLLEKSALAF